MTNYKISQRALINDANYRLMLFINDKLRENNIEYNTDEFNGKFDFMFDEITKQIKITELFEKLDEVYVKTFTDAYNNVDLTKYDPSKYVLPKSINSNAETNPTSEK